MAIKISGDTIIDDSRVIVNADKIGIGTTNPTYGLEIFSSSTPTGIALSATSTQSDDTNKAISVFNNSSTNNFSVSYRGRVDAEEYYGTFKGTIDSGVTISTDKIQKLDTKAQVVDSGSDGHFLVETDGTERFRITSTGKIQVKGTREGDLQPEDDDTLQLYTKSTDNSINRGSGITFYNHDNSGYEMGGTIQVAKENGNADDEAAYMRFSTRPAGSAAQERLRITGIGSVGIGEDDPEDLLSIKKSSSTAYDATATQSGGARLSIFNSNNTISDTFADIHFKCHSTSSGEARIGMELPSINNSELFFITENDNDLKERLRITKDGKIGINESSPDALLHLSNIGSAGIPAGIRFESLGTNNNAGDTVGQIEFAHSDANDAGVSATIKCVAEDTDGNTYLTFNNGNPSSVDERLRIDSNGVKQIKNGNLNINSTYIDFSGSISTPTTAAAIYRPADNTLAFSTKNEERLRITSDGDVGIGTDNPTGSNALTGNNAKLVVGTLKAATIEGDDITGTLTGKASKVDIANDGDNRVVTATGSDTLNAEQNLTFDGSTLSVGGGVINLGTVDTSSGHINATEVLTFNIDTDNDDTNRYFAFYKDGSDGSGTELLRIKEDGKVGIGTDSPNSIIHAIGSTSNTGYLFKNTHTTDGFGVRIEGGGTTADRYSLVVFNAAGTETFRVNANGQVGVGTAIPGQKLDVVGGNIRVGKTSNGQFIGENSSGAQKIKLDTNGSSFINGGNLGIGTNDPDGKLDVRGTIFVNGDATGGRIFASGGNLSLTDGNGRQTLRIDDPGSGNTHTHVFDSSGNLGVGLDSPTAKLHVNGTQNGLQARFGGAGTGLGITCFQKTNNNAGVMFVAQDATYGTFTFHTAGSEKLRITSDGDLLRGGTGQDIGASDAKWDNIYANKVYADIEGTVTGTASQVSITDGANNRVIMAASTNTLKASADLTFDGTNLFAGGKVLVDHNASVGSGQLQVFTKTKDAIDILSFDDTAADGGRLTFYRNRNTTYGSNNNTKVQENDSLGVIDFRGMNTEGSANYEIGASIRAEVDGTPGSDASDMPGRLIFLTTPDDSDSPEERLRITSGGQVGIGTDEFYDNSTKLQVRGRINTVGSASTGSINPGNGTVVNVGSLSDHNLQLMTGNSTRIRIDNGTGEALRISSGGVVNIGANNLTQTSYKFQVETGSNRFISFDNGGHDDFSNEGSAILFSRKNDGAKELSGLMSINDGGLLVGARNELVFATGGTSTLSATEEKLRITGIGSVGIGATNPNSLLEVRGTAGTYTNGITVFTGNTTHTGSNAKNGVSLFSFGDALKGGLSSNLLYRNSSTPIQSYSTRSSGKIEIQNTTVADKTSQIIFGGYYKGTTDFVETVRITFDGNVGIGTTNPTGSNATNGNNATLAVGTLKATTIEGDISGTISGKASKVDIANDANNRIITATGSDTLNAEADLTFDGQHLTQIIAADQEGFDQIASGDHYIENIWSANRSTADNAIGRITGKWGSTVVAQMKFRVGADTVNKDDGVITFETSSESNITERLRIKSDGQVRIQSSGSNDVPAKLQLHSEDTSISSGDHIGEIRFTGRDSAGAGTEAVGALIDVTAAADWNTGATGYYPSNIDFHTQSNSGTDTVAAGPRMRIAADGNVGVGNDSPNCKLAIKDTAEHTAYANVTPTVGNCMLQLYNNPPNETANDHATIQFGVNGGSHNRVNTISAVAESAGNRKLAFTFCTDEAGSRTEKLRITGDGKIGIGTDNPLTTLHLDASDGAVIRLQRKSTNDTNKLELSSDGTDGTVESTNDIIFRAGGNEKVRINSDGDLLRGGASQDIGASNAKWDNIYANKVYADIEGTVTGKASKVDIANDGDNRVVTATGSDTLNAEANLTFDGSILNINASVPSLKLTDSDGGPCYHEIKGPGNGDLRLSCDVGNTSSSGSEIQFSIHDDVKAVIKSDGTVGIGTDGYGNVAPLAPLHVSSYSPTTEITDHDTLRGASQLLLQTSNNVNNSRSGLMFSGALHSTDGCSAGIIANHENVAENSESTSLSFYTSHNESLGERLHITSDGKVGIGTDDPAQKIDVVGGNIRVGKTSNGQFIGENNSGSVKIKLDTSGVSYLTGGNVGIGSDNPGDYALHVHSTSSAVAEFVSSNAGDDGVGLRIHNRTPSPAANDLIGELSFAMGNSILTGLIQEYMAIRVQATSTNPITDGGDGCKSDLIILTQNSNNNTVNESIRITSNGAIAFGGSSNYGTSGQILKSNGDDHPTWVNASTISGVDVKQYKVGSTERTCTNPITVSSGTIGITSASNAYGARYISTEASSGTYCDGDIWYDTSNSEEGGELLTDIIEVNKFFQNPTSLTQSTTFPSSG